MSFVYEVTEIEGEGLGCVATKDIRKGSLILNENPQIFENTEEKSWSSKWIKSLLKSFNKMSKNDQLEYMTLSNKYINLQYSKIFEDIRNYKEVIDKDLEDLTLEIYKIEQDSEKAKTILKICCIYSSNNFENGLKIKTSRFNHSCQPNADSIQMLNNQYQVRAIGNIKAGEEINIDYNEDKFSGFRNRKHRQMSICSKWFFECSCDLCNNDVDIDANAYETQIQDAEKLAIDRQLALELIQEGEKFEAARSLYSLENCKNEVNCYKQMYNTGKSQNVQRYFLFTLLDKAAFDTAMFGYRLYGDASLKKEAENFAKAAEKFGKFVGHDVVTRGEPSYWKQIYQDIERWLQIPTIHTSASLG